MSAEQNQNHEVSSNVEALKAEVGRLKKENSELRVIANKWKAVLSKEANALVVATGITWAEAEKEAERRLGV